MATDTEQKNTQTTPPAAEAVVSAGVQAQTSPHLPSGDPEDRRVRRNVMRDTRRPRGGGRGGSRRPERARPEFDQKILALRRVARVVAGGRRFSFAVALVAGNRRGQVGVGTGKAGDTALAIEKAFRDARKRMITVPMTDKNSSIAHDVSAKYASSVVSLMPARGRGLVAGGAVRTVLEYAGVTDITSKILSRSKNNLNNARATLKALGRLHPRRRAAK